MDSLYSLLVAFNADMSGLESDIDAAKGRAVQHGEGIASRFSQSFKSQLRSQFGGGVIGDILLGGSEIVSGGALLRGAGALVAFTSQAGATIGYYRRQLTALAGDSKTAEDALKRFQGVAANSNFDTAQVVQIGTVLSSRTGDVKGAAGDTGKIVDAAAKLGINNQNFQEFAVNLEQILAKTNGKVDERDVRQLRTYAPGIGLEISRALGITLQQANQMLDTGTGKQLYNALIKVGEKNAGYAGGAAANDPQGVLANLVDDTKNALASSGDAFNKAAIPVLMLFRDGAQAFGRFNQATGGSAGLVVILGIAAVGVNILRNGMITTMGAVTSLTAAVNRLGGASASAAPRVGLAGGGGGWGGALAFGIPALASIAGGYMSQSKDKGTAAFGNGLSGAGTGGSIGSIIGGIIGTVIPGIGNVIGGAVGAVAGSLVGGAIAYFNPPKTDEQQTADKLSSAADKLDAAGDAMKFAAKAWGGGSRTSSTLGIIEREYAAYHMMRAGQAGIG